jgi:hypothetical protein
MTVLIERESIEGFDLPVTTDDDPAGTVVEFAFTPIGTRPESGDWHAGSWKTTWSSADGRWHGLASTPLIGVGSVDLAVGTWQAWIRVTDLPEIPVWKADNIRVI